LPVWNVRKIIIRWSAAFAMTVEFSSNAAIPSSR